MLQATATGPDQPMNDFTVVVLEGAFGASVAATIGILSAARKLAARLGVPAPNWRVTSVSGGKIDLQDVDEFILRGMGVAKGRYGSRCQACEIDPEVRQAEDLAELALLSAVHARCEWFGIVRRFAANRHFVGDLRDGL